MKNGYLSKALAKTEMTFRKHSPEILMGIGISGFITTTVIAVRVTPEALKLLEAAKEEKMKKNWANGGEEAAANTKLNAVETVKAAWKPYIPAVVLGTLSMMCLLGSNSASAKQKAALMTACSISETALKDYQSKVTEILGEKKEKAVREEVAQEKLNKNPVYQNYIIDTGKGKTLCYDAISGRYFYHDIEKLKRAENEINRRMLTEIYISLNEFYYEIDLESTSLGDDLGWISDDGLLELDFVAKLTPDGEPCLVVDYNRNPHYIFG